jgi:hypothetical protein
MSPTVREIRPARFRCLDNGHRFVERVWQVGQTVEEVDEPSNWKVADPDSVTCPKCRSRVEVLVPR